ncbi:Stk1 family PASTA domain-containing Ser/Thr kinase [Halobacillus massiliensis]|uniref:Stk1 family PASTA domain-containing Ser/Thr kinase n=1 Tax=Halobacillus massiliensis TaxID=1926286 RepID=UPI0009E27323|nr:Stk1 family PASTA domain-containing Ser/Thr kinase [Halobacillus massiliensis]
MLTNRLLNDRYKVKEAVGGGGMANVYLAYDLILKREVAIKVLRLEYGNDEEFIARFHREAQSATSLSHPNIVNIYDVGEEKDLYYMVMEYVDGMTLKQYIQQNSPIDPAEAIDIMRQVTSAISHAHDNDIIHRDIKPQNILIDHYGHVKVTDFGIAMALSATALTQTNSVLGSVHYLSPEQARGGTATKKSDIYSLGIVFFELLTGRLPFSGQSPVSIALKHLQSDTPSLKRWLPDLPQSVENVVFKSTAKDPFHRYNSVIEMEEDLETSLNPERLNEPVFEPPVEEDEQTKAIPVITDNDFGEQEEGETIVHAAGVPATVPEEPTKKAIGKKKKSKKKKPKKKRRWWAWLLTFFLVLLVAGAAVIFLLPNLLEPDDIEMIDVTGMEYEEAYSQLRELNLDVQRETVFSDDVEEGNVVRTDPEAGEMIKEQSRVTVYSSKGKERIAFEDYVGRSYEDIKEELEDKGFANVLAIEEDSERPAGEIIEQIQPQAGDEVVAEDTRVIFRVSSGPPRVTLQPLAGQTEDEARQYLSDNGLGVSVSEAYSEEVNEGSVISQEPAALTEVERGSTVSIVVSLGPEPVQEEEQAPPEQNQDQGQDQDEEPPPEEEETEEETEETSSEEEPRQEPVSVEVPYNEELDKEEQTLLLYIGDAEHNISEVYEEKTITEDTTIDFELIIEPGGEAAYKVQLEDEVIEEDSVSY